jgi:hypothetical protein
LSPEEAAKVQKAFQLQKLTEEADETLMSRIAPWFFEFGSWVFGGLIAYSIVLIQAPILNSAVTRGDRALMICALMLALALPLDVLGLIVLRLFSDLGRFDLEKEMAAAFNDVIEAADPTHEEPDQAALDRWRKKRLGRIVTLSVSILVVVLALTVAATAAAIWYVMWWIAVVFLAMIGATILFLSLINYFILTPRTRDSAGGSGKEADLMVDPIT